MIKDPEVNDFLEHFGVKGMKWGMRKRGDFKSRSTGQKIGAIAGGVGGFAAGMVIRKVLGVKTVTANLAISGASTVVGVKVAKNIMDNHGDKSVSSLSKS